ncbi:MAG: NADH-quinone oxidoreductase subunit I [Chloroflexi bacterium]|nr:MAG: NADH-quinone oxidoreductase subunit I [Chloroflexota bacterium]
MFQGVIELIRGMLTTGKEMVSKPVTYQYPDVKKPVPPRSRGRHELKRHANGLEKCIGCSLCAAACPADAIYVLPAENTDAERYSPGDYELAYYDRRSAIITKKKLLVPPPNPDLTTPRAMPDPGNLYAAIPPVKGGIEPVNIVEMAKEKQ